MGIYDREYYRRDSPSFLQLFTGAGQVCKWLILINVIVFVAQLLLPGEFEEVLWLRAPDVLHGQVWRLLTYAFLHYRGNVLHILFNMLFLWWFGHEMEEMYGSREFLLFYLVSALLGGAAYVLWALAGDVPNPCLGASGAVTAVMVLFAFHFPRRIILLMFILPVPIWLLVVIMVGMDTFVFASGQVTSTAVTVHLAGAAFGFGYYKGNFRLDSLWDTVTRIRLPRRRPRLRVYRETPSAPVRSHSGEDEQLEARLDAVLDKVAREGQASLTESEKAILVHASEVYRRRRS